MNGWLSPDGKFHECGINEHLELAKKLFIGKSRNPELAMEKLYWVKIVPDHMFIGIHNDGLELENLTQPQIDFVNDIRTNKECSFMLREYANYIITGNFR